MRVDKTRAGGESLLGTLEISVSPGQERDVVGIN